ncbi:MAG TPA: methyltransferase, partial [Mycobacteriales bacterium]|nr:methyltransferase [Mycobacteriales bacterium]
VSDALRRSSYTVDGVAELLGEVAVADLARGRASTARDALAGDRSSRATAVRLLLLGDDVAVDEVASMLPVEEAAPLLVADGSVVRAGYDVAPHADDSHDWWVVSDRTSRSGRPVRPDHVLGVGSASTTLAQLTVRRPVRTALDIGTGCGVQALHLSRHAESVAATDVVDRAVRLAATSFALSGVEVELLAGDLVAPVADREFDLVVCNPPFVVGPSPRYAYRDADWSRRSSGAPDGLSRRAVRSAAEVLADGGVAQLLVNWLHVRGEDWRDRVASWVSDLGVDALLLERDAQEPGDYVDTWLADAGERGDEERAEEWRRWLVDREVEAVGFGWVVLRRGSSPHRVAVETLAHHVDQPLGEVIATWLDRLAWMRTATDAELLGARLRAGDGVRLETTSAPHAGGWQPEAARLVLTAGLRWSLECDDAVAALVAGCDGSRPLGDLVTVLAAATGVAADELAGPVCATVRGLVDRGVLEPADA